jgi:glutamate carboxypeptidase
MEKTEGNMRLYEKAREIAAGLGFELSERFRGGGSGGNFTANHGVPTLDGLGALGAGAHTAGEHILISSLVPRGALLKGLLESLS